jgi:DNA-binding LacI/PurR family transcriptional regulator
MCYFFAYYQEAGSTGMKEIICNSPKIPTAVFAANDVMALGAFEALEQEV